MKADGADMALIQVEVVDKQGCRCPLDNRLINFSLMGEGRWIGSIATGRSDNYVGAMTLPVECGVNRVVPLMQAPSPSMPVPMALRAFNRPLLRQKPLTWKNRCPH